jgi:hypothetical protein
LASSEQMATREQVVLREAWDCKATPVVLATKAKMALSAHLVQPASAVPLGLKVWRAFRD